MYMPNDIIVEQGEIIHRLYIIIRGKVRVSLKEGFSRMVISEIGVGGFFGESAMLSDGAVPQQNTVKSIDFCELLYIAKGTYDNMVHKFGLQNTVEQSLNTESKRRTARIRWKRAIAQVRAVNRLKTVNLVVSDTTDLLEELEDGNVENVTKSLFDEAHSPVEQIHIDE